MSDKPPTKDIERALSDLGAEHEPPPRWQQRVLNATVDRSPRLSGWFLVGVCVVVVVVGAAMAVWWWL